jgi:hypothetical protein
MTEFIIYAILFLMLIGHTLMAGKMYKAVHENDSLGVQDKNDWKLKALLFPIYYWGRYKRRVL